MSDRIQAGLARLFEEHRIVFWYDTARDMRTAYEAADLPGVEKVESRGLSLPKVLQARGVLYGFVRYQLGKELKSARFLDSGAHSR